MRDWQRLSPFLTSGILVALGAGLHWFRPRALDLPLPDRAGEADRARGWRRMALRSRDGLATAAPANLAESVGRSLILAGVALVAVHALDELTREESGPF